ncbi:dipeptide epimerase [Sphingobium amiense]|nr:dipeptide epimerase [Sphingobium amiense]
MSRRLLTHRRIENRMREPFRIAGYQFHSMPSVVVSLRQDGVCGRGEAAGVYYLDDDPGHMAAEIERVRPAIEAGAGRADLLQLLPHGGARNAIDCALWDLEAGLSGRSVCDMAGLGVAKPLVTTFTLPADTPAAILDRLASFPAAHALKLKLDGDLDADVARMRAVRVARPDIWLSVDANQGYGPESFDALAAALVENNVALLEQPNRRGEEAGLDGWRCPVPLAADESILDSQELERHASRFDVVNIKLDKCGGLTEALRMVELARKLGVRLMVGNMAGSSLAMAPAFVVGQVCEIVDLDGAWFLADDAVASSMYRAGTCVVPGGFWGGL